MAKYLMISISVLAKIILIQGIFYKNIKVSMRLDLSGSLNRLCGVDESTDDDDLTCDCLSRLSISSTVQAGKYHHVANYNKNNSAALTGYASIHQTEPDLYLGGRSRLKFNNAKCTKNGETKELKNRTTHVFHVSKLFSTATVPNDYFDYIFNDDGELFISTKQDINSENALPIQELSLEVNDTELYKFDKDLGTMCGESLKKGSIEESLWSIFNFTFLHGNGCDFPKDHIFEPIFNIPMAVTLNEPLPCGEYKLDFSINAGKFYLSWFGSIRWSLLYGSHCA
ncbi:uncharacterized protein LOC103574727 [Microplitis demolitor]|uniref:uncharacterized protein LOC103574727 n=1 Tax=Microplitis demolitor TaxID=69319 RepID=UPI0006D51B13|nr:uncharacterized protein LOC103574727 [Microplitis demolitor]